MSGSENDVEVVRVRPATPVRRVPVGTLAKSASVTLPPALATCSPGSTSTQSAQDVLLRDARHRMAAWRHVRRVSGRLHLTY